MKLKDSRFTPSHFPYYLSRFVSKDYPMKHVTRTLNLLRSFCVQTLLPPIRHMMMLTSHYRKACVLWIGPYASVARRFWYSILIMGFDQNFRILRSIIPDPQDPELEITTDFKVSDELWSLLTADIRTLLTCFRSFQGAFECLPRPVTGKSSFHLWWWRGIALPKMECLNHEDPPQRRDAPGRWPARKVVISWQRVSPKALCGWSQGSRSMSTTCEHFYAFQTNLR